MCKFYIIFALIVLMLNIVDGFFIKTNNDVFKGRKNEQISSNGERDEWLDIKKALGLTNHNVNILKSQKNQKATKELVKRFMKESPTFNLQQIKEDQQQKDITYFHSIYNTLMDKLKLSTKTLKTSVKFELADNSDNNDKNELKRQRRKIAFQMVSDLPVTKIDELIKDLNEKYSLGDDKSGDAQNDDENFEYGELKNSADELDYMYENLYEDEEQLIPKLQQNSLQDLIMQAKHNQLRREYEETKLNKKNKHQYI